MRAEATVEIGDTDVEIRETEDGFEAVEVQESGFYVRAESGMGDHGFEIPLSEADKFVIKDRNIDYDGNNYYVAYNTDMDVSEMYDKGHSDAKKELAEPNDLDGWGAVSSVEIVERE